MSYRIVSRPERHLSRFIFDMAPPENQAFIEKIIATNSDRANARPAPQRTRLKCHPHKAEMSPVTKVVIRTTQVVSLPLLIMWSSPGAPALPGALLVGRGVSWCPSQPPLSMARAPGPCVDIDFNTQQQDRRARSAISRTFRAGSRQSPSNGIHTRILPEGGRMQAHVPQP